MTNTKRANKVIWAVNPFEDDAEALRSAAFAIRALTRGGTDEIVPVFVWAGSPLDLRKGFFEKLREKGQETVRAVVARAGIPRVRKLEVIKSSAPTLRSQAGHLLESASRENARLIVVASHGRKGLNRFALGSFAETLTSSSDTPLFVVHPGWKRASEYKRIFFPTDFSQESKQAFEEVVDFAEAHRSQIVIYHKIGLPTYAAFEFAFAVQSAMESLLSTQTQLMEVEGKRLAAIAEKRGLKVKVWIDRKVGGSIADSILKRAKASSSMIALASQSGPFSSALFGSTTRKVLRQSPQPVWVLHPRRGRALKRYNKGLFSVSNRDIESDLRLPPTQHTRGH